MASRNHGVLLLGLLIGAASRQHESSPRGTCLPDHDRKGQIMEATSSLLQIKRDTRAYSLDTVDTEEVLDFPDLFNTAERLLPRFKERCLPQPYQEEGALYSEGLALVSAMSLTNVDVMIESGTANGQSTEMMARFFEGTPTQIITVDKNAEADHIDLNATADRLKHWTNVTFMRGDSHELIPQLLAEHKDKRIGVYIDGPKGPEGLKLLCETLASTADVKFAAMHDLAPVAFSEELATAVVSWNHTVLHTWGTRWRQSFSHMDYQVNLDHPGYNKEQGWGIVVAAGQDTIPSDECPRWEDIMIH